VLACNHPGDHGFQGAQTLCTVSTSEHDTPRSLIEIIIDTMCVSAERAQSEDNPLTRL
jgi:hypothetical protein